jgi:hypothetical protein
LELIPGFGITHGNKMTWSRKCVICRYFSAGDLSKPADHLHSWHALDNAKSVKDVPMNLQVAPSKVESIWGAEMSGNPFTREEEKRQMDV